MPLLDRLGVVSAEHDDGDLIRILLEEAGDLGIPIVGIRTRKSGRRFGALDELESGVVLEGAVEAGPQTVAERVAEHDDAVAVTVGEGIDVAALDGRRALLRHGRCKPSEKAGKQDSRPDRHIGKPMPLRGSLS